MAVIRELDPVEWQKWLDERPDAVRAVAARLPPNRLYRLISTGQRVTLLSYGEQKDGGISLTVMVSGKYNALSHERNVFGIDPSDLEECELPEPDEILGSVLSGEEAEAAIAKGNTKEERFEALRQAAAAKIEGMVR